MRMMTMAPALKWLGVAVGTGLVGRSLLSPVAATREAQEVALDGSLATELGRVTMAEPVVMLVVGALCLLFAAATRRRYITDKAHVKGHS